MTLIFLLARTFPYWAIPAALIFGQVGVYFWRRRKPLYLLFFSGAAGFVIGSISWIAAGGYVHSDQWVRDLFLQG